MPYKVITPVATEPVSLEEARTQIRLTSDDPTDNDTLINAWITAAREVAEQYTGKALAPQTLELALDVFPGGGCDIELTRPPCASVTSIKYIDTAGMLQTMDAADYALSLYGDARRVSLAYGKSWPTARDVADAVQIRYVTGYSAAPKAVKSAILLMVAFLDQNRGDSIVADDIQPPAAKALLNTVKNWAKT